MDEELPSNSLNRFRKRSTRLKLDFISHSDAPVGCGGVVLRWRNPSVLRSLHLLQILPESAVATIDGKISDRNLVEVSPGKHVFAVQIRSSEIDEPVISFLMQTDRNHGGLPPSKVIEQPIKFLSGDLEGCTWSLLDSAHADWRQPEFDASGWKPMVRHDGWNGVRRGIRRDFFVYRDHMLGYLQTLGAIPVGPPKPWFPDLTYCLRFEFEIPAPVIIPDEE